MEIFRKMIVTWDRLLMKFIIHDFVLRSIHRPCQQIQYSAHMLTDVFILIVKPLLITELPKDFPFSRLQQREHGVCDRHRMLTPSWYLTFIYFFKRSVVAHLYFSFWFWNTVCYQHISFFSHGLINTCTQHR